MSFEQKARILAGRLNRLHYALWQTAEPDAIRFMRLYRLYTRTYHRLKKLF